MHRLRQIHYQGASSSFSYDITTQPASSMYVICVQACDRLLYTGWGKIKCRNTKIAISQKCVNIFAMLTTEQNLRQIIIITR